MNKLRTWLGAALRRSAYLDESSWHPVDDALTTEDLVAITDRINRRVRREAELRRNGEFR